VHIFKGAFVSHKSFPSILLAFALFAFPAFAQTLKWSAYGERPEVIGAQSERRG
jgi:hypothetical protein